MDTGYTTVFDSFGRKVLKMGHLLFCFFFFIKAGVKATFLQCKVEYDRSHGDIGVLICSNFIYNNHDKEYKIQSDLKS